MHVEMGEAETIHAWRLFGMRGSDAASGLD